MSDLSIYNNVGGNSMANIDFNPIYQTIQANGQVADEAHWNQFLSANNITMDDHFDYQYVSSLSDDGDGISLADISTLAGDDHVLSDAEVTVQLKAIANTSSNWTAVFQDLMTNGPADVAHWNQLLLDNHITLPANQTYHFIASEDSDDGGLSVADLAYLTGEHPYWETLVADLKTSGPVNETQWNELLVKYHLEPEHDLLLKWDRVSNFNTGSTNSTVSAANIENMVNDTRLLRSPGGFQNVQRGRGNIPLIDYDPLFQQLRASGPINLVQWTQLLKDNNINLDPKVSFNFLAYQDGDGLVSADELTKATSNTHIGGSLSNYLLRPGQQFLDYAVTETLIPYSEYDHPVIKALNAAANYVWDQWYSRYQVDNNIDVEACTWEQSSFAVGGQPSTIALLTGIDAFGKRQLGDAFTEAQVRAIVSVVPNFFGNTQPPIADNNGQIISPAQEITNGPGVSDRFWLLLHQYDVNFNFDELGRAYGTGAGNPGVLTEWEVVGRLDNTNSTEGQRSQALADWNSMKDRDTDGTPGVSVQEYYAQYDAYYNAMYGITATG